MLRLEGKEFLRIQMLQKLCDLYQKRSFEKKTTIPWKIFNNQNLGKEGGV